MLDEVISSAVFLRIHRLIRFQKLNIHETGNIGFSWFSQRQLIANILGQVKVLLKSKWGFPSVLAPDHALPPKVQLNLSKKLVLLSLPLF